MPKIGQYIFFIISFRIYIFILFNFICQKNSLIVYTKIVSINKDQKKKKNKITLIFVLLSTVSESIQDRIAWIGNQDIIFRNSD